MLSLCIEYNCEAYVDPFQVDIAAQIMMDVADLDGDGVNELNATFENFTYNMISTVTISMSTTVL